MSNGTHISDGEWSIYPERYIEEKRLNKLNLFCTGGRFDEFNNKTYIIRRRYMKESYVRESEKFYHCEIDPNFSLTLSEKEFKNIEQYYQKYLRIEKLKKLNQLR